MPLRQFGPIDDTPIGSRIPSTAKFGNISDYTEFDSDGRMTMVGGARKWRVLRPELQQEEIRKVLTPDGVYIGVYYGYSLPVYANDNEELFFKQRIPYRWDGVSNFEILVLLALAAAEDVGDNFKIQVSWDYVSPEGVISTVTHDVEIEQTILTGRSAIYSSYSLTFVMDYDIDGISNAIQKGGFVAFRIRRLDATDPDITDEVIILDTSVRYQMDSMGQIIS